MTASQPTPPQAVSGSWQAPSSSVHDYQILPGLRARLVALVAALLVQATIALLGVLPALPVQSVAPDLDYYSYSQPVSFWAQLAVVEFLAAIVISLAFGPGVRFGDLPAIARLVLGLGFVVLPAAAVVLGGIDAARVAGYDSAAAAASWLTTAVFGTLFFGLPIIAQTAPVRRAGLGVR